MKKKEEKRGDTLKGLLKAYLTLYILFAGIAVVIALCSG